MKKIDKVITALCCCIYSNCRKCPYRDRDCKDLMMNDAADYLAQYRRDKGIWDEIKRYREDIREVIEKYDNVQ